MLGIPFMFRLLRGISFLLIMAKLATDYHMPIFQFCLY